jgi:hypothetical protein
MSFHAKRAPGSGFGGYVIMDILGKQTYVNDA